MARTLAAASEGMPANRAATMHGIPKSALLKIGSLVVWCLVVNLDLIHTLIDTREEKELTDFLVSSAECGLWQDGDANACAICY